MGQLKNKTAFISGSTRGIGLAIATNFLEQGARVVVSSRKQASIDQVVANLNERFADGVTGIVCHVGQIETHREVFEKVHQQWGPVDILVNNAATNPYFGPLMNIDWGAFDKTFAVNLRGVLSLSRTFAQQLPKETNGAIVNVSSIFGLGAAPLQGAYGMTKAAMISMTRTLAHEWAPLGIRVNAITPGLVDTHFAKALTSNPAIAKYYTKRAALGRYGQPEEIAGLVAYLASDDASFVTGQQITIDGGYQCG